MNAKRLYYITIVAVLFVSVVFAFPTQHAFAATCSGANCTGKDPHTTGCDLSAVTLSSANLWVNYGGPDFVVGKVELRYSNICKTKWTRITSYGYKIQEDGPVINQAYAFMKKHGQAGGYYPKWGTASPTIWTKQVYAPGVSWMACGSLGEYSWSPEPIICTGASTR